MRVVYKGQIEKTETGCAPCGNKRKGRSHFVTERSFFVPSGQQIKFRLNEPVNVSKRDGEFLLQYNYDDENGMRRAVFEEV